MVSTRHDSVTQADAGWGGTHTGLGTQDDSACKPVAFLCAGREADRQQAGPTEDRAPGGEPLSSPKGLGGRALSALRSRFHSWNWPPPVRKQSAGCVVFAQPDVTRSMGHPTLGPHFPACVMPT